MNHPTSVAALTIWEAGQSLANLRNWSDRIASIENPDGFQVQICSETNFCNCRTYVTNAATLGDFDRYTASVRVW